MGSAPRHKYSANGLVVLMQVSSLIGASAFCLAHDMTVRGQNQDRPKETRRKFFGRGF